MYIFLNTINYNPSNKRTSEYKITMYPISIRCLVGRSNYVLRVRSLNLYDRLSELLMTF